MDKRRGKGRNTPVRNINIFLTVLSQPRLKPGGNWGFWEVRNGGKEVKTGENN